MKKRILAIFMTVTMVWGFLPNTSFAGEDGKFKDTKGHWASAQIDKWSGIGIVCGSDGYFRPDAPITRGEMAVILDKIMGYQKTANNTFSDLDQNFYTDAVLKSNAAGIMVGDGTTVRPKDYISRQEASVMLGRALAVSESNGESSTFADSDVIDSWAKGYVNAMSEKGFVSGVGQNRFAPTDNITRGAVVTILDHAIKGLYTEAKEFVGNVEGTVIVNADGAVLKDMVISGDLIIAEGVGKGDVTLDNVTVSGKTIVRGGGENSIHVKGSSRLGEVIVIKISDGAVSIKITEDAKVDAIVANEGSLNVSGPVSYLTATGNVAVTAVGATIKEVKITGDVTVILDKNSKVETLSVTSSSSVTVAGTVTNLEVSSSADTATIAVADGATIEKLVSNATIKVDNKGTIMEAEINAEAVVIDGKAPTKTTVDKDVKTPPANSEGTKVPSTATPATSGGGGGGGGGGSHSSTHIAVSAITVTGEAIVGQTLTANLTPEKATVTYQWLRCDSADGTFTNITGATSNTYVLTNDDAGKFIKVTVIGTGEYTGTATSVATAKVLTVAQVAQAKVDEVAKLVVGKELEIPEGDLEIASKKVGYVTEYVNSLMKDGVTATVLPNAEAGKYDVTLKLNDATATKTIAMTFVASTVVVDEELADSTKEEVITEKLVDFAEKSLEEKEAILKDVAAIVKGMAREPKETIQEKIKEATDLYDKEASMTELADSTKEEVITEKLEGFAEKSLEEKEAILEDVAAIVKGMAREPKEAIQEKIKEATDLYNQEASMTELADSTKEEVIAEKLEGFAEKSLEEKEAILEDVAAIVKGMAREPKGAIQEKIKEATDLYNQEAGLTELADSTKEEVITEKLEGFAEKSLEEKEAILKDVAAIVKGMAREPKKEVQNKIDEATDLYNQEAGMTELADSTKEEVIAEKLEGFAEKSLEEKEAILEDVAAIVKGMAREPKEAIQEEIKEATDLYDKEVAEVNLDSAIASVGNLVQAKYTAELWNNLTDAFDAAVAVQVDEDATVEEMVKVTNDLNDAIKGLVEKEAPTVDKTELETLVSSIGNILQNQAKYTEETYNTVLDACDAANAVIDNNAATQTEVTTAKDNLQIAIDSIVMKGNATATAVITKVGKVAPHWGVVSINLTLDGEKTYEDVESLKIELLNENTLLATNTLQTEKLNETEKAARTLTSPFHVGRITDNSSYAWVRGTYKIENSTPTAYELPNKVVATYMIDGITYVSESTVSVELPVEKGNATATARTVAGDDKDVNPLGAVIATVTYNDGIKTSDLSELEVSLYKGDTLLSTNVLAFGRIDDKTKDFIVIDCPFNLGSKGLDKWSWKRGEYNILGDTVNVEDLPDKVEVRYVKDGITYVSESSVTLVAGDIPNPYEILSEDESTKKEPAASPEDGSPISDNAKVAVTKELETSQVDGGAISDNAEDAVKEEAEAAVEKQRATETKVAEPEVTGPEVTEPEVTE